MKIDIKKMSLKKRIFIVVMIALLIYLSQIDIDKVLSYFRELFKF